MKKYDFKEYEEECGLIEFGEKIYDDFKKSKYSYLKDFLYSIEIVNLPISEVAIVFTTIINCDGGECYVAYDKSEGNMLDRFFLGGKEELSKETFTIIDNEYNEKQLDNAEMKNQYGYDLHNKTCEIYLEMPDGTFNSIFVRYDGCPAYTGEILDRYYRTYKKVEALINLGAIYSLGTNPFVDIEIDRNKLHPCPKEYPYPTPKEFPLYKDYDGFKPYVLDYHRWKGKRLQINKNQDSPSIYSALHTDYAYVYKKRWNYYNYERECWYYWEVYERDSSDESRSKVEELGYRLLVRKG